MENQQQQIEELVKSQEIISARQVVMQEKVDAIYGALVGNELIGKSNGLVSRVASLEEEQAVQLDRHNKLVAEMNGYKNIIKGMWWVTVAAAGLIGWLLSHLDIFEHKNTTDHGIHYRSSDSTGHQTAIPVLRRIGTFDPLP